MHETLDSTIALVAQKKREIISYNSLGDVLGKLKGHFYVISYSSEFIIVQGTKISKNFEELELRSFSLALVKKIKVHEIMDYMKDDVVHFPLFLHLSPKNEFKKIKPFFLEDSDFQNRIFKTICHSYNKYILKIAKREHISYVNFKFNPPNTETNLLTKVHDELCRFLEKNSTFENGELQKKAVELIEVELIRIAKNKC